MTTKFLLLAGVLYGISTENIRKYPCGQELKHFRPYGKITEKVDCNRGDGFFTVGEFKGKIRHGHKMRFHKKEGWKRDSSFYQNNLQEGLPIGWDSAGNVRYRYQYKKGEQVGRQENFWGPGKFHSILHFNDSGKEEGAQSEWWENGNKKSETIAKDGQIVSGTEYYPSGKPRVTYVTKYNPKRGVFTTQYISAASWAPDGRPTGSVVKGNGNYMLWSAEPETPIVVHQEFYKDSTLITVKELDSAAVEAWFKSNGK
jgi:antitoxin component YwqK of YwqJK toxin-antitoxin module